MEIKDSIGKIIKRGSYIRYIGTGTIGRVVNLKIDKDKNQWIKIEYPHLWYLNEVVQIIDEEYVKDKYFKANREFNSDNLREFLTDSDDFSLGSGGAEGGG